MAIRIDIENRGHGVQSPQGFAPPEAGPPKTGGRAEDERQILARFSKVSTLQNGAGQPLNKRGLFASRAEAAPPTESSGKPPAGGNEVWSLFKQYKKEVKEYLVKLQLFEHVGFFSNDVIGEFLSPNSSVSSPPPWLEMLSIVSHHPDPLTRYFMLKLAEEIASARYSKYGLEHYKSIRLEDRLLSLAEVGLNDSAPENVYAAWKILETLGKAGISSKEIVERVSSYQQAPPAEISSQEEATLRRIIRNEVLYGHYPKAFSITTQYTSIVQIRPLSSALPDNHTDQARTRLKEIVEIVNNVGLKGNEFYEQFLSLGGGIKVLELQSGVYYLLQDYDYPKVEALIEAAAGGTIPGDWLTRMPVEVAHYKGEMPEKILIRAFMPDASITWAELFPESYPSIKLPKGASPTGHTSFPGMGLKAPPNILKQMRELYEKAGLSEKWRELYERIHQPKIATDYGIWPVLEKDLANLLSVKKLRRSGNVVINAMRSGKVEKWGRSVKTTLEKFGEYIRYIQSEFQKIEIMNLHEAFGNSGGSYLGTSEAKLVEIVGMLVGGQPLIKVKEGANTVFRSALFGDIDVAELNDGLKAYKGGAGQARLLAALAVVTGRLDWSLHAMPGTLKSVPNKEGVEKREWERIPATWPRAMAALNAVKKAGGWSTFKGLEGYERFCRLFSNGNMEKGYQIASALAEEKEFKTLGWRELPLNASEVDRATKKLEELIKWAEKTGYNPLAAYRGFSRLPFIRGDMEMAFKVASALMRMLGKGWIGDVLGWREIFTSDKKLDNFIKAVKALLLEEDQSEQLNHLKAIRHAFFKGEKQAVNSIKALLEMLELKDSFSLLPAQYFQKGPDSGVIKTSPPPGKWDVTVVAESGAALRYRIKGGGLTVAGGLHDIKLFIDPMAEENDDAAAKVQPDDASMPPHFVYEYEMLDRIPLQDKTFTFESLRISYTARFDEGSDTFIVTFRPLNLGARDFLLQSAKPTDYSRNVLKSAALIPVTDHSALVVPCPDGFNTTPISGMTQLVDASDIPAIPWMDYIAAFGKTRERVIRELVDMDEERVLSVANIARAFERALKYADEPRRKQIGQMLNPAPAEMVLSSLIGSASAGLTFLRDGSFGAFVLKIRHVAWVGSPEEENKAAEAQPLFQTGPDETDDKTKIIIRPVDPEGDTGKQDDVEMEVKALLTFDVTELVGRPSPNGKTIAWEISNPGPHLRQDDYLNLIKVLFAPEIKHTITEAPKDGAPPTPILGSTKGDGNPPAVPQGGPSPSASGDAPAAKGAMGIGGFDYVSRGGPAEDSSYYCIGYDPSATYDSDINSAASPFSGVSTSTFDMSGAAFVSPSAAAPPPPFIAPASGVR